MANFNHMRKLLYLLLLISTQAFAQTTEISGQVTTADNLPASGVTISVKGISSSTTTNEKGSFIISGLKPGNYTVIANIIGFKPIQQTVELTEGKATTVNFKLEETANQLNEVTIKSYVAYRNDISNLATRTSTKLSEIPQSIQVIPQQILRDQQAFNINDVIRNVAGIAMFSTYQDYTMRGFRSNDGNFAYNGVRGALNQFDLPGQLYNVERIEAIKGPASSLFSNASPGGIINIVTKQPLATEKYEIQATYGTYNQRRIMADATGPLSSKLFYRFIVGYENSGAINEVQKMEHIFIAPSLKYVFSENTSATVEVNWYNDNRTVGFERGLLAPQLADGTYNLNALPIRWSRHNPNDFSKTKGFSTQLRFDHKVSNALTLHALARSVSSSQEQQDHTSGFNELTSATDNILRNRSLQYFNQKPIYAYQANIFAEAKLNTGTLKHTVVGGFDLGNIGRTYYFGSWKSPDLNIYAPDYSMDYPGNKTSANLNFGGSTIDNSVNIGGYIQDQIDLSTKIKALIGLRYDTYNYTTKYTDDATPGTTSVDTSYTSVVLPRFGFVYLPYPELSFYASYSQAFQPQYTNMRSAGGPFAPERGVQYEVGIKAELFAGKLVTTLAFYDLKKSNILIPDLTDPNGIRQLSTGAARSRGVEITIQGNINEQLSIITNYSYNKTKNLKGGEFGVTEGELYPMAPQNTANAWLKYQFTTGDIKGLGINAGFQHVGKRNTFTPGFVLPSFSTMDAGLSYKKSGINIGVNIYNITDVRHYTGGYGRGIFWAGMPRSFRATIGYSF